VGARVLEGERRELIAATILALLATCP
jgi:hypothetical protein